VQSVKGIIIFWQNRTQQCKGKADVVMVWRNTNNNW
jgi:hypothetical protein